MSLAEPTRTRTLGKDPANRARSARDLRCQECAGPIWFPLPCSAPRRAPAASAALARPPARGEIDLGSLEPWPGGEMRHISVHVALGRHRGPATRPWTPVCPGPRGLWDRRLWRRSSKWPGGGVPLGQRCARPSSPLLPSPWGSPRFCAARAARALRLKFLCLFPPQRSTGQADLGQDSGRGGAWGRRSGWGPPGSGLVPRPRPLGLKSRGHPEGSSTPWRWGGCLGPTRQEQRRRAPSYPPGGPSALGER